MEKKSPLPPRPHESGAALIVMVLLALLVLAGLVIVSTNLALGSRRTTTEQKSILPAQLAAESGVAYAKAKLTAAQKLFAQPGVPVGTTLSQMNTLIGQMCPNPVTVPLSGSNTDVSIPTTGIVLHNAQLVCNLTTLTKSQTGILSLLMSGSGGQVYKAQVGIPVADGSQGIYNSLGIGTDDASKQQFFSDAFSGDTAVNFGDTSVKSGFRPLALVQTNANQYSFYFKVAGLDSKSTINGSTRRIAVDGNNTIHNFIIQFTAASGTGTNSTDPTFAGYGLFVDDFDAGNGGYYGYQNSFSGPFHSNTIMSLKSSSITVGGVPKNYSINIDGKVTSSGCQSVSKDSSTNIETCNDPEDIVIMNGNYLTTSNFNYRKTTSGYREYGNPAILVKDRGNDNNSPDFNSDFIPMPINSTRQRALAVSGGILLNNPRIVQLIANTPYQLINITTSTGSLVNLRFDQSNNMQIKSGTTWINAVQDSTQATGWRAIKSGESGGSFNGMIYADGNISSLTGPTRASGTLVPDNVPPAISNFAAITVAAQKDISITGDLKYETPCSSIDACTSKGTDNKFLTKNILGIYASDGDIRLPFNSNSNLDQDIDPGTTGTVEAPSNLQIDGFIMATRTTAITKSAPEIGTVQPYDTSRKLSTYAGAGNKGSITVHGGTVKAKEAIVRNGSTGWNENYLFDNRGLSYAPPGFPTTTEGKPGTPAAPPTGSSLINSFTGGLVKVGPQGETLYTVAGDSTSPPVTPDFSLDKEIAQKKAN